MVIFKKEEKNMDNLQMTKLFKALGDDVRMQIFDMLRNGKLCACEILEKLAISQPTLSHHMKILCESGLVLSEKDWKWTYYTLNCQLLGELIDFLSNVKCRKK